jgi:Icc-related predicted phosphoesterase
MIRIAAVGDVHVGVDDGGPWREAFARASDEAELLLIAGDLTRTGSAREARAFVKTLADVRIPVIAVLGNHDFHAGRVGTLRTIVSQAGVHLLEGASITWRCNGGLVGIAGTKGFGGGFRDACASEFGEPQMKAFVRHTRRMADRLRHGLAHLRCDFRIALLHYAPVEATLAGERPQIHPFLGSYLLGEAIDDAGADLVLHGHAHGGLERAETPRGIPVRNVAQPVIGAPYRLFCLGPREVECRPNEPRETEEFANEAL